jgi:5-methyltetrahydrofolate--homocysteine methyltransferase
LVWDIQQQQEEVRRRHSQRRQQRAILPIEEARKRRLPVDWSAYEPNRPGSLDAHVFCPTPLEEIVPFIDWTPFFHVWELRGRFPQLLEHDTYGPRASELYQDARALLDEIVTRNQITPRGIFRFFPANSSGDDIEVYDREGRAVATFHTLRQQAEKAGSEPNYALADFIVPRETGKQDYIGAFAVSTGFGVAELCKVHERDHDDYRSIMTRAIADRLAEAFAEFLHKQARDAWGYGQDESLSMDDILRERYRGIRPAPGYPACPDHSEKRTLWRLLEVEQQTGITLTENYAMDPASSVSGLYFAHPGAKYFSVGKLGRDQILDYGSRKKLSLSAVEKLLAPYLAYMP